MGNIDILIYFLIVITVLSFLLPFLYFLFNKIERAKLLKITDMQELIEEVLKMMKIELLFEPLTTLTNDAVIKRLRKRQELCKKAKRFLIIGLFLLLFSFSTVV